MTDITTTYIMIYMLPLLPHILLTSAFAFTSSVRTTLQVNRRARLTCISLKDNAYVQRQSDEKYGRGIDHISADITEGEMIAYQDGTWYVDGNEVGDGSGPIIRYMLVDTMQIVWTHNCEHGVLNGFDVTIIDGEAGVYGDAVQSGSIFMIGYDYIQCGPEQVVAKIPASRGIENGIYVSLDQFVPDEEVLIS